MEIADAKKFLKDNHRACIAVRQKDSWPQITFVSPGIDEQGRVISATLRVSLHPIYDSQLLAATRDWRYQPAVFNGKPVKFRKIIQVTVSRP